jgi:hypothetical protein
MTILTVGTCKAVIYAGGCTIPSVVGSLIGATTIGARVFLKGGAILDSTGAVSSGTYAALGGAVATGLSAGSIAGAITTSTINGAASGATVGGLSAASVGSVVSGTLGLISGGITSGPIGLLLVGTSVETEGERATYDCWKSVLHDNSEAPSCGMLLKDLFAHPHVSSVNYKAGSGTDLPDIVIENIWNEKFKIEYLVIPEAQQIFAHAKKL